MEQLLSLFIVIPLLGFLTSLLIRRGAEYTISKVAFVTSLSTFILALVYTGIWLANNGTPISSPSFVLYESHDYIFKVIWYFDYVSAVYVIIGSFLTLLVTSYSRYYLHREGGYKRFFNTVLFFFWGYNITILSGNFETLFLGWEFLGLSSFLLIAFYRDRYLPVKNALKVFSVYRIGDVGLVVAIWACHHLFHENVTFLQLEDATYLSHHIGANSNTVLFISIALLAAACAKSAQLPFSSWLPRAMEGPTPSSAIFYGSLSVHIGVFLLLRTFPLWEDHIYFRVLIGIVGASTSVVASLIARVQSSVKSQIAYSSIAQIGLIFIETALGLHFLALIHFAGNAFLRTYQLLVSPSMVSYMIREQFYTYVPRIKAPETFLPKKLENTLFMLSLKEWNLDSFMDFIVWKPARRVGRSLGFLSVGVLLISLVPIYLGGIALILLDYTGNAQVDFWAPPLIALFGLLLVLRSIAERRNAMLAWVLLFSNHLWILLAIGLDDPLTLAEVTYYLAGIIVSGIGGIWCLLKIKKAEKVLDLTEYHGFHLKHPKVAFAFLLCCLGLAAFPITSSFIGIDLMFLHIGSNQWLLAYAVASSFILSGISLMRMYARLFLGTTEENLDARPNRSS